MSNKIFVIGFPSCYGGAGQELHHQIIVWRKIDLEVNLIPSSPGYKNEPLYNEMLQLGVIIHDYNKFEVIEKDCPVVSFCNSVFLENIPLLYKYSKNLVFINCMTWLFEKERLWATSGMLTKFLYQNQDVLDKNSLILQALNPNVKMTFLKFNPYFDSSKFPFIENRTEETFGIGHISRQDADKFSKNTLHVWEYCVAPVFKKGYMLGFDKRSEDKIGKPYDWIKTYVDQKEFSQQDFYKNVDIILQPTDTTENWPRIGFEAMSSGCILIVDNRGGWKKQIKHGVTGWLCNHERDFIYYASKMAYEPELRKQMAKEAKKWCDELSSLESSMKSWEKVFGELNK